MLTMFRGRPAVAAEFWSGDLPTLVPGLVQVDQRFVVHARPVKFDGLTRFACLSRDEATLKVEYPTGVVTFKRGEVYTIVALGTSAHGELNSGWGGTDAITLQGPDGTQSTIAAHDLAAFRLVG